MLYLILNSLNCFSKSFTIKKQHPNERSSLISERQFSSILIYI